jgi:hypothetical protein
MRTSACIGLVIASAAMLVAGISTRGARADRSVEGTDHVVSVPQAAAIAQRTQLSPRSSLPRPAAQRAADRVDFARLARHPGGPCSARDERADDGHRFDQMAALETAPRRKMRALSMDASAIPVELATRCACAARGGTGLVRAAAPAEGERTGLEVEAAMNARQSVVLFDRLVININLAGGS